MTQQSGFWLGEQQLRALIDALPLGAYLLRLEHPPDAESLRLLYANAASVTMLGVEADLLVGRTIGECFPNTLGESGHALAYRDVVVSQTPRDLGVITYGDHRVRLNRFASSAYPIGPDAVLVLFENLSASHARVTELAAIVESADDAILSKSLDGTILTWNASAERIYGYTAQEAIGRPISMLLPPDRKEEVEEILARLRGGERVDQLVTRRTRKDGAVIDVSLTVSPIRDTHGMVVAAATIARDISRQKEAEARAQQLAAIVDASDDAIFSRALDGRIISWNSGAERLFGYTAAEIVGESIDHLLLEERQDTAAARRQANRGEATSLPATRLRRRDGSEVDVAATLAPIFDAAGQVSAVSVVIRDVTGQRELENQLRQSQKLESIGSLAGGIAHDFNNILTVIRATTHAMLASLEDAGLRRRVSQIELAAEHAAALTGQLLAFSRQQVLQPELSDLSEVVATTLELVRRLIGEQIELEQHLARRLVSINVDRAQLQQVILNLSVNARDAMGDGGRLSVRTSNAVLDDSYLAEHIDVSPGLYALLEITDSGAGMDPLTLARIFDPFYTTKADGTGLGLSTVYGIVKQSSGHIQVYSEPGFGTTFKVYFPAAEGPVPAAKVSATPPELLSGHETILLVEDAEMVRSLATEMLEASGYTILAAADGSEALALARAHPGGIDLLLTDIVMPGMNGRELAEQLVRIDPGVRVLFTSGYPADTIIRHGITEGRVAFIQKPYAGSELLSKIRSTLAGG
jgi:PAS domain S-box-containing protein